ncbi:hypothetical protein SHXM_00519 [Streptomyces hygroscopicus]|nr:hypothetical protein SHXM_00519 [Streptomyces hygroscopicus]
MHEDRSVAGTAVVLEVQRPPATFTSERANAEEPLKDGRGHLDAEVEQGGRG